MFSGLCSTPGVFNTVIDTMSTAMFSTLGDTMSTLGGYHNECGDIMSTPEDVQYTGISIQVQLFFQ